MESDISRQVMKGIQMYMQRMNTEQQLNSDLLKQSYSSLPDQH